MLKLFNSMIVMIILLFMISKDSFSQGHSSFLEYMGLRNKDITSIGNYGNVIAAGTMKHGVYWKDVTTIGSGDTSWNLVGFGASLFCLSP